MDTRSRMFRAVIGAALCAVVLPALAGARSVRAAQESGQKPFFLVATPDMPDPMFAETVILMLPPTQPPLIVGLIVNKPTNVPVLKVFPDAHLLKNEPSVAYFGGPVYPSEPSLILRGSKPGAGAPRIFDDISVSTDPDKVAQLVKNPGSATDLRVVLGRAQWSLDQLHAEILEGSWYVLPADPEIVFSPKPKQVWRALVQRAQLQEVDLTPAPERGALEMISTPPDAPLAHLRAR